MIIDCIRIAEARAQGKEHIKNGVVCQDFTYSCKKNGVHAIALSDGAGSRKKSHLGSKLVSQTVAEYVADNFIELLILSEKRGKDANTINKDNEKIVSLIMNEVTSKLEKFIMDNKNVCMDDLSCTMLFAAIKGNQYLAGHIGDGVIGLLKGRTDDDELSVLSHPENGGAPNITFFITDNNASEHLRIYSGECLDFKGFVLMSDGPEEALYNKKFGLSNNTKILFNSVKGNKNNICKKYLATILEKKISEISYDDLSVAIIYRDSIDTSSENGKELLSDLLNNIYDNQIIPLSSYSVLIDDSIDGEGKCLGNNERLEQLLRSYGKYGS